MKSELSISASPGSSAEDFDFLIGRRWNIRSRRLNSRLTGCTDWTEGSAKGECRKVLTGLANIDSFKTELNGKVFEGMAVRLFNPKTRLWSIYWADNNLVTMDPPQVGSFDGPTGDFLARDFLEGTDVIVRFHWDKTDPDAPVWSQAFSTNEGETWEWNWYMHFTPAEEKIATAG
jgi:hypothetical protein